MPCPKDGSEYIEIDDKEICPKCGHSRGYKQIDWVEVLTQNGTMKRQQAHFLEDINKLEKEIVRLKKIIEQLRQEAMGKPPLMKK